ncbi:MAG: DUF721 domain-containing protein [Zoogloeaceae bacterium]|jgi:hypothetical protein|nr:DUF721 domain-containing protein [Zoogloeaceae bacterium]
MYTPEKLLERSDATAHVLAHARLLFALGHCLAEALPAGLAGQARVVNYRQGVMVIHAANGATAAKLRQISPRLCDHFLKKGFECNQIELKVQPLQPLPVSPVATVKPLSRASAAALTACADALPNASPLKQAVRRLLERSEIR